MLMKEYDVYHLYFLVSGRQVGSESPCREKLEKTIILYTKVVSKWKLDITIKRNSFLLVVSNRSLLSFLYFSPLVVI